MRCNLFRTTRRFAPTALGCAWVLSAVVAGAPAEGDAARSDGRSADWWARTQNEIAASEYHATWRTGVGLPGLDAAWQAPNRAHGIRTYFTPEGLRIVSRREALPAWSLSLDWVGYGRGAVSQPVLPADLAPVADRVEFYRGALTEVWVNGPDGLRLTLTLPVAPVGPRGPALPLSLELALGGPLAARFDADRLSLDLLDPGGARLLRIAGLTARDALERELAVRFEPAGGRHVRVVVDDAGAVYPLTVGALLTSPAWSAEGDQAEAVFGASVATAGDVNGDGYSDVIVGAPGFDAGLAGEGRAYVYLGSVAGLEDTANWTTDGGQTGADLGRSVATAGDLNGDGYADVVIGAPLFDESHTDEGAARVFLGSPTGSLIPGLAATGGQAGARFGSAVGTAGDVNGDGYSDVIVGVPFHDDAAPDEGAAAVFRGSETGLSPVPDWIVPGFQAGARFGQAVGTAGDVNGDGYADVIVAAPFHDNGGAVLGAVVVYHGSGSGISPSPGLTLQGDQNGGAYGAAVSTAGDVNGDGYADVVIGAPDRDGALVDEGRAWVHAGSPTGVLAEILWFADGGQQGARFGVAASTAGDVNGDGFADVMIGAGSYDTAATDAGRTQIFHGSLTGPSAQADWTADGDQADARLGESVATAGDVNGDGFSDVLLGAPFYDNGQNNEGRALAFRGGPAGLASEAGWIAESDQPFAAFGSSVSTAGDVDGDGYSDVLVGAPLYDGGAPNQGRAYAYHGTADGLVEEPLVATVGQAGAEFGTAVSTAGDVNGDGYSDVIVGAPFYDAGTFNSGAAFVYHGSAAGLSAAPDWITFGVGLDDQYGGAVSTAGDVNGDGYSEVVVASGGFDDDTDNEGVARVFHGAAEGLSVSADWSVTGGSAGAILNRATTAGDVNGDGYSDLIVGLFGYGNGQVFEGQAAVYHGSLSGLAPSPAWVAEGDQDNARFGFALGTAGDVNGDGYSDIVVGAPFYDNGEDNEGRAYVYEGSPTGLSQQPAWSGESDQANSRYGFAVGTAGDVNGDGYSDVIVGAYRYDHPEQDEGAAFVYHGSALGLSAVAAWTGESDQAGVALGRAVGTAGDVNGDGYADVIVGSRLYSNEHVEEGGAFVYYGNEGPGLSARPQQRRADDTAPIALLGASDDSSGFRIAMNGRGPFGRGRVKLEWEVKRLGALFDGSGTQSTDTWADTDTTGVSLSGPVSGLVRTTPYHWRARLLFDPVTSPFLPRGRWTVVPLNGWHETDLRTPHVLPGAGAVPDGHLVAGQPLLLDRDGEGRLVLDWAPSCVFADRDYAVYRGNLGEFDSHAAQVCSTSGATELHLELPRGSAYFLVVPHNELREGSYGVDGDGVQRAPGTPACLPQLIVPCS